MNGKPQQCTLSNLVRAPLALLVIFTLLLGGVYPLLVTLSAQLMPGKAQGSLIEHNGKVAGSALLGQEFTGAQYFWGRLSAANYDAAASGGSNLSPANSKLQEIVTARVAALKKLDPANKSPIPSDLVMASASGLDPHISIEAAYYQLPRVAKARKMKEEEVRALIKAHSHHRWLGVLGEPRVDVLPLNMALDRK